MSKLSNFLGKAKTFKIGEKEMEIQPLGLDELELVLDLGDEKKRNATMQALVKRTLELSVTDSTEEERSRFGMMYFEDLVNAMMDVNNLAVKKDKVGAIPFSKDTETLKKESSQPSQ